MKKIMLVFAVLMALMMSTVAAPVNYVPEDVEGLSGMNAPAMKNEVIKMEEPMLPEPVKGVISDQKIVSSSKSDAELIAQTVWGEARGCSDYEKELVVWVILNRVDDGRFGKGIRDVVTAPYQFAGYSAENPVDKDILELCEQVIYDWHMGQRGLSPDYLYFWGDGYHNHFYTESGETYDVA